MSRNFIFSPKESLCRPHRCGGKATALAKLQSLDLSVPSFFVITTRAFKKYQNNRAAFAQKLNKALDHVAIDAPVSVRSSAPYEDQLDSSLAGQLVSVLDVRTPEAIRDAVFQVWDSVESANARFYTRHSKGNAQQLVTAVVVQKMVFPEYGGVLFTEHPNSKDPETLLIEVVPDSCANLVSGQVDPIQIVFHRAHNAFIHLPDKLAHLENIWRQLIRDALKIEARLKEPQDIEWCLENGKIWFLQTRPITTMHLKHRIKTDDKGIRWTDYFFSERFTEPISPMGWSLLREPIINGAIREPLFALGKDKLVKKKLSRRFHSLPFTRLDAFHALYSVLPSKYISADKKAALELSPSGWFEQLVKALPFLVIRLLIKDWQWIPQINLLVWHRFKGKVFQRINSMNLGPRSIQQAQIDLNQTELLTRQFLHIHRWSITFADIFEALLKRILQKLNLAHLDSTQLLGGFLNRTVQANLALERAGANSAQRKMFLQNFGYRSQSLDVYQPTWREQPQPLFRLFEQGGGATFQDRYQKTVSERQNGLETCRQIINKKSLPSRMFWTVVFDFVYRHAAQFTLLRENQRDLWQQILAQSRHILLQTGMALVETGQLEKTEDIFFLNRSEFLNLPDRTSALKLRVQKRRQQYKNDAERLLLSGEDFKSKENLFHGIGVSRGRAQGRVRVARRYDDVFACKKGEILVAHAADPAWTPVFNIIAGLVLEVGGVLSHASILAREFQVPTVTSLNDATRIFKNGDTIQIDGSRGTARRIETQSTQLRSDD